VAPGSRTRQPRAPRWRRRGRRGARRRGRRELREETGYEADTVERFATYEPANGISNAVHHYFVARGCEPTAEQDLDFNEAIRVTTESYDDLLTAVRDGDLLDGRTALGVLQYELG